MQPATKVTLRVDVSQLDAIMDHLDRAERVLETAAKRRYRRFSFRTRAPFPMVCMRQDGPVVYQVAPRNISARGLSALIGGFVYPQTPCHVAVPAAGDAGVVEAAGRVLWCRHVSRTVHEAGVEFDERVDIRRVLGHSPEEQSELETGDRDFHRLLSQQVGQLASLARDRRSMDEIKEAFERVRRTIAREEAAHPEWRQ